MREPTVLISVFFPSVTRGGVSSVLSTDLYRALRGFSIVMPAVRGVVTLRSCGDRRRVTRV